MGQQKIKTVFLIIILINFKSINHDLEHSFLLETNASNYNVIGPDKSGLYLSGNTKSIKIIGNDNPKLLVANNNSELEVFELNK